MCNVRRRCPFCGAGLLPVLLSFFMLATVVLSYAIAVVRNDVDPFFPYISDTGALQPESSIFGLLLNFSAALCTLIIYTRYRLVKEFTRGSDPCLSRFNKASLAVGFIATFGLAIVANFQDVGTPIVHWVGALLCFSLGIMYGLLHSVISYRMYPLYNGVSVCHVRLFLSLLNLVFLVITMVCGVLASNMWNEHPGKNKFHWKQEDSGYTLHVVSAVSEWMLAVSFVMYFFTYVRDFNKLHVAVDVQPLVQHLDESPAPSVQEVARLLHA